MHVKTLGKGYFDYRTMNSQNSDPNSYLFSNILSECQKWGPCSLVNHMFPSHLEMTPIQGEKIPLL